MPADHKKNVMLGEAGELLVASRFFALGYAAAQFPRNYKSDDLYVDRDGEMIHVQVKTTKGSLSWLVGTHIESSPNRFYALVHFDSYPARDPRAATVYLLPSSTVAKAVNLHAKYYLEAHPNPKGPGLPNVADHWRMEEKMSEDGFGRGWLEPFEEPWSLFRAGKLV